MKYKLVMDSSGDLHSMEHVPFACAPLKIQAGERGYSDDCMADVADMVTYLHSYKGTSASACPSIGDYLEAFADAENVYCITITSNLSGSYNAAKAAGDEYMENHPGRNVHVFDSLTAGPEMTLLAEKVRELILAEADHKTIVEEGEAYLKSTRTLFALESMHNLAANGRVPHIVAKATGILGIRLIGQASDIGTIQPVGKARGETKVAPEIYKQMTQAGFCGGRVRIHHCFNPAGAEKLRTLIHSHYPDSPVIIGTTGILCSFYAEKGGMIIGYEVNT